MGRSGHAEPLGAEGLHAGRAALERADWDAARSAFTAVLESEDSAEARDGLALALWFLGDVTEAVALRERAFDDYVRLGRCDDAVRAAVWVSHQHMIGGRPSAARGWLARSERALEGVPACAGHGWVAVERARQSPSVQEQITHATRALAVGRAMGQSDLEVLAVSLLGRATVDAGRWEEGLRLLEEAMAAATAGRVRNVHTLAEAYCNLIMACSSVGDWERATEWCELVDSFARRHADRTAVRCLPNGARRRAGGQRTLGRGRERPAGRTGDPCEIHPADERAGCRVTRRAARPAGTAAGGRGPPRRARGASRRAASARAAADRRRPAPPGRGVARAWPARYGGQPGGGSPAPGPLGRRAPRAG